MVREIKHKISCVDDYDPESLTPEQANELIKDHLFTVSELQQVPIRKSLGRILGQDISSKINVPSARNSAMDGYAINSSDIPEKSTNTLTQVGISYAGKPYKGNVKQGECVRIMTGAVMPDNCDTVIMQEHVETNGDDIIIDDHTKSGANVREAGEDLAVGDTVLLKGTEITPAELGLIASLGAAEVPVYRQLKVAFFSTGDELRSIGEELTDGQIYDSNRYTLYGMLERLGVEIFDLGVVCDEPQAIESALMTAADRADVILTSGGVSVGDADFVKQSLEKLGQMNFWKIAMKPGRPLTFGKINDACFFGLPGNPVSVMVTFYQFVQPALKQMMGSIHHQTVTMNVRCLSKLKKRSGRIEFQRGVLYRDETGKFVVEKTGNQGSGILRSMAVANCFIILPLESNGIDVGDEVMVQPFFGLV